MRGTVPVNKTFTFDDCRTIVHGASVCVSFQMETERNIAKNGTERKRCVKRFIDYAQKLSNALDREIG